VSRLHMRLVALTSKGYVEGVDEGQFGPTLLILLSITTTDCSMTCSSEQYATEAAPRALFCGGSER
jgi:hypothetical protein